MGTDGRKMSKSYNNAIYLSDPPKVVAGKLKTMVTDPQRVRRTDPGNPEVCPVFSLHKVFSSNEERARIDPACRKAAIGCIDCKEILAKNLISWMNPIYENRGQLAEKPSAVLDIFESGSKKARQVASQTMAEAKEAMKID